MPSNYKRKTTQQNWDADAMKKAIEAVQSGEMNFSKAATMYGIPRSTLKRRVKNKNVKATDNKKLLGCCAVFTDEQEMELVNIIFEMEEKFGKLSFLDVRSLAYQLAERKNLRHTFSKTKQIAGKDWLRGFRKRHPEVVLRNPEIPWLEKGRAIKAARRAMMAAQNPISSSSPADDGADKKKNSSNAKKKILPKNNTAGKEDSLTGKDSVNTDHSAVLEDNLNVNVTVTQEEERESENSIQNDSQPPGDGNSDSPSANDIQSSAESVSVETTTTTTTRPTTNSLIRDILNAPSLEPSPEMDLDTISPQSPSEMTIKQKPMFGIRGGIVKKKMHSKRDQRQS